MVRAGVRADGSCAIQLATSLLLPTAAMASPSTSTLPPPISRRLESIVTTTSASLISSVMEGPSAVQHTVAQPALAQVAPVCDRHAVGAYRQFDARFEWQPPPHL